MEDNSRSLEESKASLHLVEIEPRDFRSYLRLELVDRCKRNQRYSLRAFAKTLGVSPAYLSLLLNAKRKPTFSSVARMGQALGLSPAQILTYQEETKNAKAGGRAAQRSAYRLLADDHFQLIADWYHFAILELTKVQNFSSSPRWVAAQLGISIHEVNEAVERLQRLQMLRISPEGQWLDISGHITNVNHDILASARKKLQRQILEKALAALDSTPLSHRNQTAMTMAIDTRLIPQAVAQITNFRRKLAQLLESSAVKDGVYNLSISLYPLTPVSAQTDENETQVSV